jgi:AraC family transcriptional activator of pobA
LTIYSVSIPAEQTTTVYEAYNIDHMGKFLKLESFYKTANADLPLQNEDTGHFNIVRIEDLSVSNGKAKEYSRRSYYKVSLVSGHSKIHYADRCFEILEAALVFTNPMIPYDWERISEEQTGYICIFTEEFFNNFGKPNAYPVFSSVGNSVVGLNAAQFEQFHHLFIKMKVELVSSYAYKHDLLRCLLLELVHEAQKLQPVLGKTTIGTNAYERIAVLFTAMLERQYPLELNARRLELTSPSAFANLLNIHVNHLNKALKEITGSSTSEHIVNRMLLEAKTLLKNSGWTVAEVAWALAFDEPNHFSTFFKRHTGLSPKQFKVAGN